MVQCGDMRGKHREDNIMVVITRCTGDGAAHLRVQFLWRKVGVGKIINDRRGNHLAAIVSVYEYTYFTYMVFVHVQRVEDWLAPSIDAAAAAANAGAMTNARKPFDNNVIFFSYFFCGFFFRVARDHTKRNEK